MAFWLAVLLVAGAANSVSAEEPASPNPLIVTLHVDDYARVPAGLLVDAQRHASQTYQTAGVELVWTDAPWSAGTPDAPHLRVVILNEEMAIRRCSLRRTQEGVLGQALVDRASNRGFMAYVFPDRVEQMARTHHGNFVQGLGHVLAHEIGHLLLGAGRHTDTGLMRPLWDPRETVPQHLTAREVDVIKARARVATN